MSSLRCRPGDLALYVGAHEPLRGCLFRCVRYVGDQIGHFQGVKGIGRRLWAVEPLSPAGEDIAHICDDVLRPLRGDPQTDDIEREQPCLTT